MHIIKIKGGGTNFGKSVSQKKVLTERTGGRDN
jgi:hypothetical protein